MKNENVEELFVNPASCNIECYDWVVSTRSEVPFAYVRPHAHARTHGHTHVHAYMHETYVDRAFLGLAETDHPKYSLMKRK
jgi:hypothetical protein